VEVFPPVFSDGKSPPVKTTALDYTNINHLCILDLTHLQLGLFINKSDNSKQRAKWQVRHKRRITHRFNDKFAQKSAASGVESRKFQLFDRHVQISS